MTSAGVHRRTNRSGITDFDIVNDPSIRASGSQWSNLTQLCLSSLSLFLPRLSNKNLNIFDFLLIGLIFCSIETDESGDYHIKRLYKTLQKFPRAKIVTLR